ncbi:MAG: NAD(P)-dependent oxidoreductase [Microscillaceae bacterium]|jgi:citronellol/citronellal dehydrogenase|nr:NAD(P)-dependent oxidoreductase [Microscillaceae bacterium]
MNFKGKTVFITGASRGIGQCIGLRLAREGANIIIAAKTAEPHPKLPGTVYTAAEEMEKAGGQALPLVVDVREEAQVYEAVNQAVAKFGGIDILINNASAIQLTPTLQTDMKRYDLMHQINTRGTFLCSKACIPHLLNAENPHVLNISPPLNMETRWFAPHVAYTMAKFGMSMCVLGMAGEFKGKIAFNALWPRTAIATAAVNMLGGEAMMRASRKPEIMADAAYFILSQDAKTYSGNFLIDDEVLQANGITDLDQYANVPGEKLAPDFFI